MAKWSNRKWLTEEEISVAVSIRDVTMLSAKVMVVQMTAARDSLLAKGLIQSEEQVVGLNLVVRGWSVTDLGRDILTKLGR